MSDLSKDKQNKLVIELGSAYVFNILYIADQDDEDGLDAPLENKYKCLQPIIDYLIEYKLIRVESYDEDGEQGEEYLPSDKAEDFLEKLKKRCDKYLQKNYGENDQENIRKAFFDAMSAGEISTIDETNNPWYKEISSFSFYEKLLPDETQAENETEEEFDEVVKPIPRSFREESGESAIDLERPEINAEESHRRYLVPSIINMCIALVFVYAALNGSVISGFIFVIFFSLSLYYFFNKVSIVNNQIISKNWLYTRVINIDDIGETTFVESDEESNSFEVIGGNGVSITVSKWIEDFSGFRYYVTKLASEQG